MEQHSFQEVMRQWKRMCDSVKSCVICPMYNEDEWAHTLCSEGGISSAKPEVAEAVVAKWAAEHPEPVYPTWWKYLCMMGIIPDTLGDKTLGEVTVDRLMSINIPADIAQKLGIEPKEGT